ncbi:MAG TPA: PGPGW domain-containing protein [Candidatus Saccharimonadales bacterium]|nr:PGPGW domain-containing protein [Candidatus Saccharimonadales bacterium]
MMQWFKNNWRRIPYPMRKFCVFVLGWLVVLAGVAMLALPGPGWAAIFLGFAILATEFTTARTIRDWMVARLKTIINWFKRTVASRRR